MNDFMNIHEASPQLPKQRKQRRSSADTEISQGNLLAFRCLLSLSCFPLSFRHSSQCCVFTAGLLYLYNITAFHFTSNYLTATHEYTLKSTFIEDSQLSETGFTDQRISNTCFSSLPESGSVFVKTSDNQACTGSSVIVVNPNRDRPGERLDKNELTLV